jgi:hypothetical protein
MRLVTTEYVLICDPDSVVVAPSARDVLRRHLELAGVAGFETGGMYHPALVAFPTRLWKQQRFSFEGHYPGPDVGAELTTALGGITEEGLLRCTQAAPVDNYGLGQLWEDSFSTMWGGTAVRLGRGLTKGYAGTDEEIADYHRRWNAWADEVAYGDGGPDGFPT